MLAQTKINTASRQTAVDMARPTSYLSGNDVVPASCLVCEIPMTLVRIKPKVVSFSEVDTFRCFTCGHISIVESKKAA